MRILFLGNLDNLGYELGKWCREFGAETTVFSYEHELPRCQPELVDPGIEHDYPEWYRIVGGRRRYLPLQGADARRRLERDYDIAIASGPRGLVASGFLKLPKILYAIGGEVAEAPFPFAGRWQGPAVAAYRALRAPFARAAIRDMDAIVENYDVNLRAMDRLGIADKRVALGYPEDAIGNREKVSRELVARLTALYAGYERVFLWLTRLNYRVPEDAAYKGVDRYLDALEAMRPAIEAGRIRLVFGDHGHDREAFRALLEERGFSRHADWVPHLPYLEMLAWLALPNAVVFGKFGESLGMPAAIDRDALTMGAVLVSTLDPGVATAIYGAAPPVLHAVRTDEIAAAMMRAVAMGEREFRDLQATMRDYGERHIDYRAIVPKVLGLAENIVARGHGVRSGV